MNYNEAKDIENKQFAGESQEQSWTQKLPTYTELRETIYYGSITSNEIDRIFVCLQALANIPDPAKFVERAKKMEEALIKVHDLILTLSPDCECQQKTCFDARSTAIQALKASE